MAAVIYSASFLVAYRYYVHPTFDYTHYEFRGDRPLANLTGFLLAVAPVFAARWREVGKAPAMVGAALIYAVCYVPIELMLAHMIERGDADVFALQLVLAMCMGALFLAARRGYRGEGSSDGGRIATLVTAVTVAGTATLFITFRDHLRIVSFADVYDLRGETADVGGGPAIAYLSMWLPYAFVPYLMARWLLDRTRTTSLVVALAGCLLMYASTGSKAALLLPVILIGLNRVLVSRWDPLSAMLGSLTVVVVLIVALFPDEGILMWVKSILLMRIFATAGWTFATYYDYFSSNGHTYYTHIGPVNALTDAYPYGEHSMGQLIGLEYNGTDEVNYNAGFWASDGVGALGIAGLPLVTLALCLVLYAVNRLASGYSSRFVTLWLCGFWLALLNVPLTTALLSGGGILVLLGLWAARAPAAGPQEALEMRRTDG
ncbi:MAG: hypothetical protein A2138_17690 [Deltaproteobacteria bacterium RBG_16_71_12]|nr:MAG: hypothetical protein A2138_17690 [Deltaproteobacteria bacterium RBG_16_71_12]